MLLLLLACTDNPQGPGPGATDDSSPPITTDDSGGGDDTGTPPPPVYEVSIDGPATIDPKLAPAPLSFVFTHEDEGFARVAIEDETGAVVRSLADGSAWVDGVEWDGRDGNGAAVVPGRYTLHLEELVDDATVAESTHDIDAVRVGVTSGTLGGADRVALTWHFAGGPGMYWSGGTAEPTFEIADIDDGKTGEPATLPTPWEDTYAPPSDPMGQNMPAAFPWNAQPELSLTLGGDIGDATVGLEIEGWTLTNGTVAPGETVTFTKDEPISDTVGVWEPTLVLAWTDLDDNVIGTRDLPLRVYLLLGQPTFDDPGDEHQPWVAAVDPALRAISGTAPTPQAVTSALVQWIYDDLGLFYDIEWGASYYNGGSYTKPRFAMTQFLERAHGDIVNCSDCAGILNAYANMIGADLFYAHIFSSFDLNYIEAIGYPEFTHCPFGPGGCGFSYHAVTTLDAATTIWDATLALDGDKDPSSDPSTELMVEGIEGGEYLYRLSPDDFAHYDDISKGSIR